MPGLMSRIRAAIRRETGTASLEAVLVAPMLFVASCELTDLFLGFRMNGLSYRAAYSVADALARTDSTGISQDELDDLYELFQFLLREDPESGLRVSVVALELDPETGAPEEVLKFSHVAGPAFEPLTDTAPIAARIPTLGLGDEVIVTETFAHWEPLYLDVGTRTFHEAIVTRPRFVTQVLWDE